MLLDILNVEKPVFFLCICYLFYERIKLIYPSLAALFTCAACNFDSQVLPRARTVFNDAAKKLVALRKVPGSSLLVSLETHL